MDDSETLHRRARLRELVKVRFGGEQKALLAHILSRTGKAANQGELSLSCADCAAFRAGPNERCVMF